jgi:hypothetical protein
MTSSLRVSILCLCLGGLTVQGGVREDFPDFFPKEPDRTLERNGWDLLPTLKKIEREDREGLPPMFNLTRLSRADAEKARALALRFAENLRILERILDAPRLHSNQWRTFKINGEEGFPSLQAATTAHVMLAKAIADAHDGEAAKGVEAGLRVVRFGLRACESEPLLVDLAVCSAIIDIGAGAVAMAAMQGMDSTALRKAAKDLDGCDTAGAAFRQGLKGEARWALLNCDPLLQGGQASKDAIIELAVMGEVVSAMLVGGAEKEKSEPVTAKALREKWKKELPDHVKAALRDAEKVNWRAHTEAQAAEFRALMKADNRSLPAFKASFHPSDTEAEIKGTALEPFFQSKLGGKAETFYMDRVADTSARIRQARAFLLLRAYHLDHGCLPASLDELTPGYWPSVPADPYDGKPLRYDATSRMVWCVGMNLKDEKGANTSEGKDAPDDSALTFPEMK